MKKVDTHIKNNKIQKSSESNFNTFSAQILKNSLEGLLEKREVINIALSGGSTPLPILYKLKDLKLDWSKINFFLVDERVVDIKSTESNYKNIFEVFYQYIPSRSYPILRKSSSVEEMLLAYERQIKKNVMYDETGTPKFDLIILGMGNDGHTASLFPETMALLENKEVIVQNYVPQLKSLRVTMTFPVLLNSNQTIVFIKGKEKVKIFEEIMKGKGEKYPISRLVNTNLNWIIGN